MSLHKKHHHHHHHSDRFTLSVLFLISIIVLSLCLHVHSAKQRHTMVWLCLERCEGGKDITKNLNTLSVVSSQSLTAVSFERYDLGDDSTLYFNPSFTTVVDQLRPLSGYGGRPLRLIPMITSVNIDRMRVVFDHPEPFIEACLSEAERWGYHGYNIDWEPEHGVVEDDAPRYVTFLQRLATEFHRAGLELNVDIASWSVLWDTTRLFHETGVDRVITMDTYAGSESGFRSALSRNVAAAGEDELDRLGVGLMSTNPNTGQSLGESELKMRFDAIEQVDAVEIDIWRMTQAQLNTSSIWWEHLHRYLSS